MPCSCFTVRNSASCRALYQPVHFREQYYFRLLYSGIFHLDISDKAQAPAEICKEVPHRGCLSYDILDGHQNGQILSAAYASRGRQVHLVPLLFPIHIHSAAYDIRSILRG